MAWRRGGRGRAGQQPMCGRSWPRDARVAECVRGPDHPSNSNRGRVAITDAARRLRVATGHRRPASLRARVVAVGWQTSRAVVRPALHGRTCAHRLPGLAWDWEPLCVCLGWTPIHVSCVPSICCCCGIAIWALFSSEK